MDFIANLQHESLPLSCGTVHFKSPALSFSYSS